jgi:hypothetical protein
MLTPEFDRANVPTAGAGRKFPHRVQVRRAHTSPLPRTLISDWLVARGHDVLPIDAEATVKPHRLMTEARLIDRGMIYREDSVAIDRLR